MKPRVFLLSGSTPPDACGIGDYTASLASALESAGQPTELICHRSWSPAGTAAAMRRLPAARDAIIHIQYPTMGYRYSLGPQYLSLARRCVVTVHEFTAAHRLRQLSLVPFTVRSSRVVMTSEFESRALVRVMPWVSNRISVIPIGSNIPSLGRVAAKRENSIAYFGLIMPKKGLESFIEFARIMRSKVPDWEFAIIGRIAPRQDEYARGLMDAASPYGVKWILDHTPEQVADLLAHVGICYLPFPDGASERRGSLKATCVAGAPCITTFSEHTPRELVDVVVWGASPPHAADAALYLIGRSDERARLSARALAYAQRFSWRGIAEAHIKVYQELVAGAGAQAQRSVFSVRNAR